MTELIQAAKAVIADWNRYQNAHFASVNTLRAAVERAEIQNAGFDAWFLKNYQGVFDWAIYESIKSKWTSVQQTERERIKQIITYQFGDLVSDLDEVFQMIDDDSEHLLPWSEHLPAGDQVNPENPVNPVQK